jgi:hypothetical protein
MAFADGYNSAEAQLLMTLCGFTYIDGTALPGEKLADQEVRMRRDINAALASSTPSSWRVVWGPGLSDDRGNMLYVAGDTNSQQLAVAIRGTDWTFWLNWVQDLGVVLPLQPFTSVLPSTPANNPRIAAGTNIGLKQLEAIRGSAPDGTQLDLATFLRQSLPAADIFVSGHSLGGCLASVLAPSLAFQLGSASNLKVYTFAAPSAGDANFADYYNRLFMNQATVKSTAYRVYNSLDVVPNSWASLSVIETYYDPAPRCTGEIKAIVDHAIKIIGTQYAQVGTSAQGSAVKLDGSVVTVPTFGIDPVGDALFFRQLQQQHGTSMYQHLLNTPVVIPPSVGQLRAARATLLG